MSKMEVSPTHLYKNINGSFVPFTQMKICVPGNFLSLSYISVHYILKSRLMPCDGGIVSFEYQNLMLMKSILASD